MGELNFSWKVALAARCSSVYFDKKIKIQLYLQPEGMDVHTVSLSITGNPGMLPFQSCSCWGNDVFGCF